MTIADPANVELIASGGAFVDLSSWRKVAVSGAEALEWLDDLVSADIRDLTPGKARRSLLLSPTGRVRAEFTVTAQGGTLYLLQDPAQTNDIGALLGPYVLSSDVVLEDRSGHLALFSFPARSEPPSVPGASFSTPSCAGRGGVDLIASSENRGVVRSALAEAYREATMEDLEAWRVISGIPRVGVDVSGEDLPQEGGLEDAVSFDKGCFVGQEAVAKVRNLGHPRRVLRRLHAEGSVAVGDRILHDGREAGEVTSAADAAAGSVALARVRWELRAGPFITQHGIDLIAVDPA
ncbi:MAG: YgfZ/GcvT domain-containing protein [Actinomycetota bacterium]